MQNGNMLIDRFAKRLKESYPQADRNNPYPAIYYDDFCSIVDEIAAEMNSIDTVEAEHAKLIDNLEKIKHENACLREELHQTQKDIAYYKGIKRTVEVIFGKEFTN